MFNTDQINQLIQTKGFSEFKWIDPKEIVVAQWVRVKCLFGCSDYGLGTCPPNTPTVQECSNFFKEYSKAIIVRVSTIADKDDYPKQWSKTMTNLLLELEREVFLCGFQKAFLLNQTCCGICNKCTGTRLECKHKERSRPSPEAFAVDVYQTVRKVGMEINVIAENPSEMNRIAILLIE